MGLVAVTAKIAKTRPVFFVVDRASIVSRMMADGKPGQVPGRCLGVVSAEMGCNSSSILFLWGERWLIQSFAQFAAVIVA